MKKYKANRFAGLDLLDRLNQSKVKETERVTFGTVCRTAMIAFKAGCGSETHWHSLAKCLNVAMVLAEFGVMPEGLSAIEGGQDALEKVYKIGTWQLGSNAFAINCAINIFLRQLEIATNRQVVDAEIEVIVRVEQSRRVTEDKSIT